MNEKTKNKLTELKNEYKKCTNKDALTEDNKVNPKFLFWVVGRYENILESINDTFKDDSFKPKYICPKCVKPCTLESSGKVVGGVSGNYAITSCCKVKYQDY